MNAGIIIKGNSGRVQIDSDYQNLFVAASGNGGTIPSDSGFSDSSVLAFQSSSLALPNFGTPAPSGCKWWVFDVLSGNAPSHGYGLVIATSSGKLIFDATQQPLRIAGDVEGASKIGIATSFPSGRNYAVIATNTGGRFTEGSEKAGNNMWTNHSKTERVAAKVSDRNVTIDWITTNEDTSTGPDQLYDQGSKTTSLFNNVAFTVVDVTGY